MKTRIINIPKYLTKELLSIFEKKKNPVFSNLSKTVCISKNKTDKIGIKPKDSNSKKGEKI